MKDIIVITVLVIIIGLAACYVYKAKKNGQKCIGCPDSGGCGCGCSGCPSEGMCSENKTKK